MTSFLLDANIPYSAVRVFEDLGLKVNHAVLLGLGGASDEEIMDFAIKNRDILITKDKGFANIEMFPPRKHNGIVIFRLPYFFNAAQFANVLRNFLLSIRINDLEKAITIVKLGKFRIRKF
ncbi:MAG TPA: DUF5615 family PIN-like protein [Candidatus Nanoarchaeia archaeon]|nr:DUF5615 family PIN-like protein [Candidatus Nanoarchaeia archaeon]